MVKKRTVVSAGFAVAAVVAAAVVNQVWISRQGGPVSFGERQSLEEYMGHNLSEEPRMADSWLLRLVVNCELLVCRTSRRAAWGRHRGIVCVVSPWWLHRFLLTGLRSL